MIAHLIDGRVRKALNSEYERGVVAGRRSGIEEAAKALEGGSGFQTPSEYLRSLLTNKAQT